MPPNEREEPELKKAFLFACLTGLSKSDKNVETTQIYAGMSDETKRQSVDRITLKPKTQTLSVVKTMGTER